MRIRSLFLLCLLLPANLLAATVQLPETGQTTCYDSAGTAVPCAGTGQDGAIKAGAAWPTPRFLVDTPVVGTVTDNLTGLIWTKDGNSPGPAACAPGSGKDWQGALNHVACLNSNSYLGFNDWRLPNDIELESLVNVEQTYSGYWLEGVGFINVQANFFWASSTYVSNPAGAWVVDMLDGSVAPYYKTSLFLAWPVRGGQ